MATFFYLK